MWDGLAGGTIDEDSLRAYSAGMSTNIASRSLILLFLGLVVAGAGRAANRSHYFVGWDVPPRVDSSSPLPQRSAFELLEVTAQVWLTA